MIESKKLRKLAKKSGFIFWKNEPWGPGKGHIDWGTEYDDELVEFARRVWKQGYKAAVKDIEELAEIAVAQSK